MFHCRDETIGHLFFDCTYANSFIMDGTKKGANQTVHSYYSIIKRCNHLLDNMSYKKEMIFNNCQPKTFLQVLFRETN